MVIQPFLVDARICRAFCYKVTAMDRPLLLTIALFGAVGVNVNGQEFSKSDAYVAFYESHFNPKFEANSEPTLALWWIIEHFDKVETPRDKLRDLLVLHAKLFPDSKHADRVKSHLNVVERMLGEDRPPNENKFEQLIFDLRDLNMRQWHQPNRGLRIIGEGSLRFDGQLGKTNPNPDAAQQLVDIGYDAIPLLIDHIDDDTLTRSVDYWRNFTFSHRVLTVGECCRQIIDTILPTGRQFNFSTDPDTAKRAMKNHYRQLIAQKRAEQ